MKLFSQRKFDRIFYVRICILFISFCIIAFDCDFISSAREAVTFSVRGSYSWYKYNPSTIDVTYYYPVQLTLSYDDLVSYLGSDIGDTLTFTLDPVTDPSYQLSASNDASHSVVSTSFNNFIVTCTPAGGGDAQETLFAAGESTTISYGGGNLVFQSYASYLKSDLKPKQFSIGSNSSTWKFYFPPAKRSNNDALNDLVDNQEQYRQEDRDSAEQAGSDAGTLVEEMQTLKEKWAILWYPIEFTNSILSVFTGGSSSANYIAKYYNVKGYTYDDNTGYLVPIRDPVMTISMYEANSSGSTITFPAYTLPILNVKLWDSYTFDLSFIKDSFPLVFDSLYVVVSCLEIFWFVSFLKNKFNEVFG